MVKLLASNFVNVFDPTLNPNNAIGDVELSTIASLATLTKAIAVAFNRCSSFGMNSFLSVSKAPACPPYDC